MRRRSKGNSDGFRGAGGTYRNLTEGTWEDVRVADITLILRRTRKCPPTHTHIHTVKKVC